MTIYFHSIKNLPTGKHDRYNVQSLFLLSLLLVYRVNREYSYIGLDRLFVQLSLKNVYSSIKTDT